MELDQTQKKAVLSELLKQLEARRYSNEIMGRTWTKFGNAANATGCAKEVSECMQVIAELESELKTLEQPTP